MTDGKKKNKKNNIVLEDLSPELIGWASNGFDDNSYGADTPSLEVAEEMKQLFVRELKKDLRWKSMMEDLSEEKANEMLKLMEKMYKERLLKTHRSI
jgi:alanine-alpha-ketoisovalerate/valine-pyruvate aminotransferase